MKRHLVFLLMLFLWSTAVSFELAGTRWMVHNNFVEVEFQKADSHYQAVAVVVSPKFDKVSVGDTIIRNLRYSMKTQQLTNGNIQMGSISAQFSATLQNDSLLAVTIKKFFISQSHVWKRSN